MYTITTSDRLENAAERGRTSMHLFVWASTVKSLSKQGITFKKEFNSRSKGYAYYFISWENAVVDNLPENWSIKEITQTRKLTQGQYLWLLAEFYNKEKNKKNK